MYIPITEKQIMQLKRGDALLIHGTFRRIFSDGDIGIDVKETNIHTDQPQDNLIYVSPTCVSLPSQPPTSVGSHPKYDPCRMFRKGDVAEVSQYKGRAIIPIDLKVGDKVKVCENEKAGDSIVHVIDPIGRRFFVNPAFLELITPIDELEPYGIIENLYGWIVFKDTPGNVMANFNKTHPNPKEAAETERDRLNAEHRKEQK